MDQQHTDFPLLGQTANDRFKGLWERAVAWSTFSAVAVHAVVIGWAGFTVVAPLIESRPAQGQMALLPHSLETGVGLQGPAAPVSRPEEEASDLPVEPEGGVDGPEEGGAGEGDATRDLWAAAANRLGYGGVFTAEVVEVEEEVEDEGKPEGDSLSIALRDSTDLLADLGYADSLDLALDLERLTEIRPELAVMIPSMWILLRNPTDVESYLQRSYRRWSLDRDEPGSVTVTVWIDTRGSVEWAEVSRSSGRQNLDEAALELFNEIVAFRPARHEGVSVSGSATFALLFPW